MKLANPRSFNKSTAIKCPIELVRPPNPKYTKDQIQIFKCRVDPKEESSVQCNIVVPYFDAGTPEQWIYFQQCLKRVLTSQGDTKGPQQYKKTRMLLKGEALVASEGFVSSKGALQS